MELPDFMIGNFGLGFHIFFSYYELRHDIDYNIWLITVVCFQLATELDCSLEYLLNIVVTT